MEVGRGWKRTYALFQPLKMGWKLHRKPFGRVLTPEMEHIRQMVSIQPSNLSNLFHIAGKQVRSAKIHVRNPGKGMKWICPYEQAEHKQRVAIIGTEPLQSITGWVCHGPPIGMDGVCLEYA